MRTPQAVQRRQYHPSHHRHQKASPLSRLHTPLLCAVPLLACGAISCASEDAGPASAMESGALADAMSDAGTGAHREVDYGTCSDTSCVKGAECVGAGYCLCATGHRGEDGRCLALSCSEDDDCDDGDLCNGEEACVGNTCSPGASVICATKQGCHPDTGACGPRCTTPSAPLLTRIHAGARLRFDDGTASSLRWSLSPKPGQQRLGWVSQAKLELPLFDETTAIYVSAQSWADECAPSETFNWRYEVAPLYEAAAGSADSTALPLDDERFVAWATGFEAPVQFGTGVEEMWTNAALALGPAVAGTDDVVSLGNGGSIVITFDPPIKNGKGADFAVFENGFGDDFLELAFVEVSSDGEHFERFDSAYLGEFAIPEYGTQATEFIGALAGKYRGGFGVPFELETLKYRASVQSGKLDLTAISHVRVVDIVGDGSAKDSFGHAIFDPTPTTGPAGFDLEAIGVLHEGSEATAD